MLQVICCKYCGQPETSVGQKSVDVSFNDYKFCDKCYNGKTHSETLHFCSVTCFKKFFNINEWTDI